jgi:putative hydrolase of the HAD superfamily
MVPFDAVLFDLGGVVLTDSWDYPERWRAADHFHLDREKLDAGHHAFYVPWDIGKNSMVEYLNEVVFNEPRSFSQDEFIAFMMNESQLLPNGAMGILKEIAASDQYMVGSLNNEPRETNEYRIKTFGLRQYLQVAFSSCYLGVRKPEPQIFRLVLDVLGKPAERILFIDDRQPNVEAAAAMGIHSIHFTGEADLRQELEKLGVL